MFKLAVITALLGLSTITNSYAIDYPIHSDKWTTKYDHHFKKYSKRYFGPLFNWHWFKAQGIAESGLKENSQSTAGAQGIMQLMPNTFNEIESKIPHINELHSPRWNIAAGIYYDRYLYRKFKNRPTQEKLYFTLASYNAGYRRILDGIKRTKKQKSNWENVQQHIPSQTRAYVTRIRKLMDDH